MGDRVPGVLVALEQGEDAEEFAGKLQERDEVMASKKIVNGLPKGEVENHVNEEDED